MVGAGTERFHSGLFSRWYLGGFDFVSCLGLWLEWINGGVGLVGSEQLSNCVREEKGRAQQQGGRKGFAL